MSSVRPPFAYWIVLMTGLSALLTGCQSNLKNQSGLVEEYSVFEDDLLSGFYLIPSELHEGRGLVARFNANMEIHHKQILLHLVVSLSSEDVPMDPFVGGSDINEDVSHIKLGHVSLLLLADLTGKPLDKWFYEYSPEERKQIQRDHVRSIASSWHCISYSPKDRKIIIGE